MKALSVDEAFATEVCEEVGCGQIAQKRSPFCRFHRQQKAAAAGRSREDVDRQRRALLGLEVDPERPRHCEALLEAFGMQGEPCSNLALPGRNVCGQHKTYPDRAGRERRRRLREEELGGLGEGVASGITITVPAEPHQAGRDLVEYLGAEIVVEPEPAALPARVEPAPREQEEPMANGYTPCKIGGCERPSLGATYGPYARLCNVHTQEARERKSALHTQQAETAPAPPPAADPEPSPEPEPTAADVPDAALNGQLEPLAQRLVALAAAIDEADTELRLVEAELEAARARRTEAETAMTEAIEDLRQHV